jgi:hypothetical protein
MSKTTGPRLGIDPEQDSDRAVYQIKLQGHLDPSWDEWFNGMTVASEDESNEIPVCTLTGPVADQSALRGMLSKIWDLNMTLISVIRIADDTESLGGKSR